MKHPAVQFLRLSIFCWFCEGFHFTSLPSWLHIKWDRGKERAADAAEQRAHRGPHRLPRVLVPRLVRQNAGHLWCLVFFWVFGSNLVGSSVLGETPRNMVVFPCGFHSKIATKGVPQKDTHTHTHTQTFLVFEGNPTILEVPLSLRHPIHTHLHEQKRSLNTLGGVS